MLTKRLLGPASPKELAAAQEALSVGAFSIALPIIDKDRFLTLVATDSGNGLSADWVLFGDPRLELLTTQLDSDTADSLTEVEK